MAKCQYGSTGPFRMREQWTDTSRNKHISFCAQQNMLLLSNDSRFQTPPVADSQYGPAAERVRNLQNLFCEAETFSLSPHFLNRKNQKLLIDFLVVASSPCEPSIRH